MLITNWALEPEDSRLLSEYFKKEDGSVDYEKQFDDKNCDCLPLKIAAVYIGSSWINLLDGLATPHVIRDKFTGKTRLNPESDPDFQKEWFSALFGYSPQWKMVGCQLTSTGARIIFVNCEGESRSFGEIILDDWEDIIGLDIVAPDDNEPHRHFIVFLTRGYGERITTFIYEHLNYVSIGKIKIIWSVDGSGCIIA